MTKIRCLGACQEMFEGERSQDNLCEGCREHIAIQVEHLPPDEAQREYDARTIDLKAVARERQKRPIMPDATQSPRTSLKTRQNSTAKQIQA